MENTTDQNAAAPAAYDAGDRRHVERREKTAKTARLQRNEDFRWLMGDLRGRRFVWDLLAKAGLFRSSLGLSPELTAFNEGRRDLGATWVAADPFANASANDLSPATGSPLCTAGSIGGDIGYTGAMR